MHLLEMAWELVVWGGAYTIGMGFLILLIEQLRAKEKFRMRTAYVDSEFYFEFTRKFLDLLGMVGVWAGRWMREEFLFYFS